MILSLGPLCETRAPCSPMPSHGYDAQFYYQTSPAPPHPSQPHPETRGQSYNAAAAFINSTLQPSPGGMDKSFFCAKVTMIKKVARLAFLESGDEKGGSDYMVAPGCGRSPGRGFCLETAQGSDGRNASTQIRRSCSRRDRCGQRHSQRATEHSVCGPAFLSPFPRAAVTHTVALGGMLLAAL